MGKIIFQKALEQKQQSLATTEQRLAELQVWIDAGLTMKGENFVAGIFIEKQTLSKMRDRLATQIEILQWVLKKLI